MSARSSCARGSALRGSSCSPTSRGFRFSCTSSAMPVTFPHRKLRTGPYFVAAKVLAGANLRLVLSIFLLAALAGWLHWRRTRRPPRGDGLLLGLTLTVGIPAIVIVMAFLMSRTTNLLAPWCVAVLSPLALFAFARFLGWVHETGAWREAYVSGGALLVLYCLTWYWDPEDLKSNARETAMAVAARAAGGDLVIVTPETLASSFNFYFRPKNPQIDFPAMRREEVVRYDNRLNRLTVGGWSRPGHGADRHGASPGTAGLVRDGSQRHVGQVRASACRNGYGARLFAAAIAETVESTATTSGLPLRRRRPFNSCRRRGTRHSSSLVRCSSSPPRGPPPPRWPGECRVRSSFRLVARINRSCTPIPRKPALVERQGLGGDQAVAAWVRFELTKDFRPWRFSRPLP